MTHQTPLDTLTDGKYVTISLDKGNHYCHKYSPFKKGEILKTNMLGIIRYNIIVSVGKEIPVWDEDLGDAQTTSITLRPLSKFLFVRKIQVGFVKFQIKLKWI